MTVLSNERLSELRRTANHVKFINLLFTNFRHPDDALPGFVSPTWPPPIVPEAAFYFYPRRAGLSVSFQITILKVLAGQTEGPATLPELTRQVSILVSSGPDWTDRMKRLAALAPGLNIFQSRFVFVDRANWQITDAGRAFLISLETPTSADNYSAITEDAIPPNVTPPAYNNEPKLEVTAPLPPSRLMRLIKRRRPVRPDRMRRSS